MNYIQQDLKELQSLQAKKQSNFAIKLALGTATVGGTTVGLNQNQEAEAIAVADVSGGITEIITAADGAADVALPIGLAIVGIGVLAMILRRFIMV